MNQNDQVFYMNDIGEIRSKGLPGKCMDPQYGVQFGANYFIDCQSDSLGPTNPGSMFHFFTSDSTTEEQFKSVLYSDKCVEYVTNEGTLSMGTCDNGNNQKFYANGGSLLSVADWSLIQEGNLPWISALHRNPRGNEIKSDYGSGDTNKYYVEVAFYDNVTPYQDYKILFPELRDSELTTVSLAEIKLPGLLLGSTESSSVSFNMGA